MDPFRPSPPTFNYMEQRRNQEAEVRSSQDSEQSRKPEMAVKHEKAQEQIEEKRRAPEMEQRREEKLPLKKSPPRAEIQQKNLDLDVPELEEEDIPDLEDVDEDVDGPPPKVICLSMCLE